MRKNYLAVVCKQYWLMNLLCVILLAGAANAQTCPSPLIPGKAAVSATKICAGNTLNFSLNDYSAGDGLLFFLEQSNSMAGPFNVIAAPQQDPSALSTVAIEGTNYYRIGMFCTTGNSWVYSDTLTITGIGNRKLFGHYTINSAIGTSTSNFGSFSEAIMALHCGGVSGAVVFDVTTTGATYNEQLIIPEIDGASDVNTITFNCNGNTLAYAPHTYDSAAVLKLNGADHFIFDSLRIDATGGSYGMGIQLINNADSNTFRRCYIDAGITNTSYTFAGVAINGTDSDPGSGGSGSLSDGNVFDGNTIVGGNYGMTMNGGWNDGDAIKGNRFTNNDIRDFNQYGIYISYTDGAIIAGNRISRPVRTVFTSVFNGIYITSGAINTQVTGNRVFSPFGANPSANQGAYGINVAYCDATAATPNIISNNLLYNFNGAGPIYALYTSSADYAHFYNNTVSLDNAANTSASLTRGIDLSATAVGLEFKNNIVTITRGGGGSNYCMYIESNGNSYVSDHNDFYVAAASTNNIGYSGSARATLADWRTATTQDAASVSVDPLYRSLAENNYIPNNTLADNKGVAVGIATDITGAARSTGTPDVGAFEFSPLPCGNPPVAGVVVTSENPICASGSAQLSIRSGDLGVGLLYQWQSSPDSASWTNIAAATGINLTITQTTDTWYRLLSTCGTGSSASPGILIHTLQPTSGVYTINKALPTGGTNFQSFNDAWNSIKCGINGAVVFNVAPSSGPYNEQLIMNQVSGASAVNTITFNGNGNSITYTSTNSNERAVMKLNGADHIIIDNLVIKATGKTSGEFGYAVQLLNNADSNIVRHCAIYSDTATGSFNYAGIAISGSASDATAGAADCDYNLFEDNTITGGFFGMTLVGQPTLSNIGNTIRRNKFLNFYTYGIYNANSFLTVIDSNTISRPTRAVTGDFQGIYLNGNQTKLSVTRNRITNPFGGNTGSSNTFYGIASSYADGAANLENIFSNNIIDHINGGGTIYGIYNSSSDRNLYYHNTVNIDGTPGNGTFNAYGFYQENAAIGIRVYNNIIAVTRSGDGNKYAMYFAEPTSVIASDNNNLYIGATDGNSNTGFSGTDRKGLAAWQLAGYDATSTASGPKYKDAAAGNYEPTNADIDNRGKSLGSSVPVDYTGKTRNVSTPDVGAYEFTTPACTTPVVAGTAKASVTELCENGAVEFNLTGNSTGQTQTYQWQSGITATGSFAPASNALSNPLFTIQATETRFYRAAVTCAGTTTYTVPVLINVHAALPGGTYIIDTNGTGNFRNFTEAKAALSCGIKGPVVFSVKPNSGTYNEQLVLDSTIAGVSATNTITFLGNGNTLHFSSADYSNRAVIALNGAHHIIFDSLKIDASGDGSYGWGVFLTNNADNNTFRKCTILIPQTSAGMEYAGIVLSSAGDDPYWAYTNSGCDNNLFQGNTISGGFCAVCMPGQQNDNPSTGNRIIGNTIKDFHQYGVYIKTSTNTVVEGNDINRAGRTNLTTFYGVEADGNSNNLLITGNRIHGTSTSETGSGYECRGINIESNHSPADKPVVVSNNLLYDFDGAGDIYGCYNFLSEHVNFYHNTVVFDNAAYTGSNGTYAFYQYISSKENAVKNNVATLRRGGSGVKYGIYYVIGTTCASDNNDIWLDAPAFGKYWGYLNGNYPTLAAWQTATGTDMHSYSADPLYTNAAAYNFTPTIARLDNTGAQVGVASDILNVARNTATPDIGAYEFSTSVCATPPTPGVAVANPSAGICMGTTVKFTLSGNSVGGFQKYLWQRGASATGPWTNISDSSDVPDLTHELASPDMYFRGVVVCGTGVAYATPVQVTLNQYLLKGDYTIDPAQPASATNFGSFNEAVAAMHCGIGGSVRFLAAAGTYYERVIVPKIPGASDSATVTFLSKDNDAASVILTTGCTADSNYVLRLDSTNYISFRNITITATGTNYGRAVEITGTSSNDSVAGCIINVPSKSNVTTDVTGIYGEGLRGSDNAITGNTITNGVDGIYLNGVRGAAGRFAVDSNKVSGSFYTNIMVANIHHISVSGNTINKDGLQNLTTYGIYMASCDTVYTLTKNNINISNTGITAYAMYFTDNRGTLPRISSVSANKIIATTGNAGNLFGITIWGGVNGNVMNNVIDMATTGDTAYGMHLADVGSVNCYNNTVQNQSASTTSVGAYFANVTQYMSKPVEPMEIYNNVFTNTGGGIAMCLAVPEDVHCDYNLLYSTGTNLLEFDGLIGDGVTTPSYFSSLKKWVDTVYTDKHSLVYKPAFAANTALMPDINSPDVWAMQGRGIQVAADSVDFNGNKRATTLTDGVPDLGAYEFVPAKEPVLLTAIPATPAPYTTQTFMLGTDTVTKITWGATVPADIKGKRYSGVEPTGLANGQPHMFFYTAFTTTGATPAGHTVEQYYLDPWRGFIPDETIIKMGKTNAAAWEVSGISQLDTFRNVIKDTNLVVLDKFTGLTDGHRTLPPFAINTSDSSNRGTQFWVGYGHHQLFDDNNRDYVVPSMKLQMVLYLGAGAQPAHVTVKVNGTEWIRTYDVPANTVITTDYMPKYGLWNARLQGEGLFNTGISIESNTPITANAHIYSEKSSGATMLMPVGTYGYEYYALTPKQSYYQDAYSWFYVVAAYDNTTVEITPSNPTQGGHAAGVPFTVTLQKGQVYQVLGANINITDGYDLTGSKIRSVTNAAGKCFPVAVFSGSSRTNIGCSGAQPVASGDNLIQQNFPYRAWGRKYLVTPTSQSGNATLFNGNIFKVYVRDPATVVKRNGTALAMSALVDNRFYLVETNAAEYIEADQPVMIAQFIPSQNNSECGYTGDGDPEMIYLSPVEQGIREVTLARTTRTAITTQYLTLTIPDNGLNSLTIDGSNQFDYTYKHPNAPGYTVVVKRWDAANAQTAVKSDSAFTAITYGLGDQESYGFNAGTLVHDLHTRASYTNVLNPVTGADNQYTCAGTPFKIKFFSTVQPDVLEWQLGGVPNLKPDSSIKINKPVAVDTVFVNGATYYEYMPDSNLVINAPGSYNISVFITHPDIDACDSRLETVVPVEVHAAPVVDFTATGLCLGTPTQFTGSETSADNSAVIKWAWNFGETGTAAAKDTVHLYSKAGTYQVSLGTVDANGCVADTTKPVVINGTVAAPVAKVDVVGAASVTFSWGAVTGATGYEVTTDNGATWTAPSSGATGLTHTVNGLQTGTTVTLKVRALGGCTEAISAAVAATTVMDEVYIPNSFTPQTGLAENQLFKVYGSSIKVFHMMVFNQWGEKIFETKSQSQGWDGTYKGQPQPSGVYIYVADLLLNNNQHVTKKGTLNLIR
ncbi:PKD domain-containing protein [Deminuibacter soli]|uniref:PKD domain-containing protein n=1 Tax=Deminuibacter soli TaxID=2291815 RepID=A0A3E1NG31_9BACT|nr:PKD domain-containing protein [Deminuibacter soli]RFM26781.1 PKD domain-containing protein [Deminuibacter soli]